MSGADFRPLAYRGHFAGWRDPWNFADAETTARRLEAEGLTDIETWLEEAPVDRETAEKYAEFVSCVCIRHHLDRLPPEVRSPFTADLTARAAVTRSRWTTGASTSTREHCPRD